MSWDFSITLSRTRCPCGLGWIKHGILINDWNQQKEGDELDCIYCDTRRMIEADFGNDIQKKYSPDFLLWYREYMHQKIEKLEADKRRRIYLECYTNLEEAIDWDSLITEEDSKFLDSVSHDEDGVYAAKRSIDNLKTNRRSIIADEMVRIAATDDVYAAEKMVRFEEILFNSGVEREQIKDAYKRLKEARKLENVSKEDYKYIRWHKAVFGSKRVLATAERIWYAYLHFNNAYTLYTRALNKYNNKMDDAEKELKTARLKLARKKNSDRYMGIKRKEGAMHSIENKENNKARDALSDMHKELFELVCGEYAGECEIIIEC